jgi:hypothetical protein
MSKPHALFLLGQSGAVNPQLFNQQDDITGKESEPCIPEIKNET